MSQQSMFEQGHPGSRMRPAGESTRNASFAEVRKREPGRQESRMKGSGLPTKVDELGPTQRELYDTLKAAGKPLTDREVEERSSLRISSICARRDDLIKAGLVTDAGKRPCTVASHNRKVTTWKIT